MKKKNYISNEIIISIINESILNNEFKHFHKGNFLLKKYIYKFNNSLLQKKYYDSKKNKNYLLYFKHFL
jgi:hypothetical protein